MLRLLIILALFAVAATEQVSAQPPIAVAAKQAKASCWQEAYRKVWELVARQYLFADRLASWQSWKHRFDGHIQTESQARQAIAVMLASLGDEFTFLLDPEETLSRKEEKDGAGVVESRMLTDGVAYLKLKTFQSGHLVEETKRALSQLSAARAYVIDLRNNKGGLIDVAFAEFSLFADEGTFGIYTGRDETTPVAHLILSKRGLRHLLGATSYWSSRQPNLTGTKPLVVLVNNYTRSAAEMFAGALRDNGRAKIFGARTFGKGILQDVCELPDGSSVKITTARFFLPGGQCIHGRGLLPDKLAGQAGTSDRCLRLAVRALTVK